MLFPTEFRKSGNYSGCVFGIPSYAKMQSVSGSGVVCFGLRVNKRFTIHPLLRSLRKIKP